MSRHEIRWMNHLGIRELKSFKAEHEQVFRGTLCVTVPVCGRDFLEPVLPEIARIKSPRTAHKTGHGPCRHTVQQLSLRRQNKFDASRDARFVERCSPIDMRRNAMRTDRIATFNEIVST